MYVCILSIVTIVHFYNVTWNLRHTCAEQYWGHVQSLIKKDALIQMQGGDPEVPMSKGPKGLRSINKTQWHHLLVVGLMTFILDWVLFNWVEQICLQ